MKISDIVLKKIREIQTRKPPQRFNWNDSLYEDIQYLSIDERGQLGEEIAVEILKGFDCNINYNPSRTSEIIGYDFKSNGKKIEAKLATITIGTGQFQHENLHSQRDFDAILFIDIAPNKVFLTAVRKENILWKNLHRRPNGDYKCDFTIKHIENNNIPRFSEYKTGAIASGEDFFDIYKHIDNS